jgi:hypothetical protein
VILSWHNWFSERLQCSDRCHDMCDEKFISFKLLIEHAFLKSFAIFENHFGMRLDHLCT